MGDFAVLSPEQQRLAIRNGIDPAGYVVLLDNDRCLCMMNLKTRDEITIHKNKVVRKHGS